MKNQKNPLVKLLVLKTIFLIVVVSILVSSCTTCKSSQYRRKYFSSIDN